MKADESDAPDAVASGVLEVGVPPVTAPDVIVPSVLPLVPSKLD